MADIFCTGRAIGPSRSIHSGQELPLKIIVFRNNRTEKAGKAELNDEDCLGPFGNWKLNFQYVSGKKKKEDTTNTFFFGKFMNSNIGELGHDRH